MMDEEMMNDFDEVVGTAGSDYQKVISFSNLACPVLMKLFPKNSLASNANLRHFCLTHPRLLRKSPSPRSRRGRKENNMTNPDDKEIQKTLEELKKSRGISG